MAAPEAGRAGAARSAPTTTRGARAPIGFGLQGAGQFPGGMPDHRFFRTVAEDAERLGFDSLWAGEHLSFVNPIHDAYVALSFFAGCTRRIHLGTGILMVPLRHPSWTAKSAASLDRLSDGRLILGVGVGGEGRLDFEAAQVPIQERGRRCDESIEVVRKLWGADSVSHHGRFFGFDGVTIAPKPTAPHGPPVWVGGKSKAALRRVARLGDGWLPAYVSVDRYSDGMRSLEEECAEVGRSADEITPAVYLHTRVSRHHEDARAGAAKHFGERYGKPVGDHVIDRLCLVGDPEHVIGRITAYLQAGVRHVVCIPMVDPSEFPDQIAVIAEEVVSRVRR